MPRNPLLKTGTISEDSVTASVQTYNHLVCKRTINHSAKLATSWDIMDVTSTFETKKLKLLLMAKSLSFKKNGTKNYTNMTNLLCLVINKIY